MPKSLSDEIRGTFSEATLQAQAARGLKPDDWARYQAIQQRYEAGRRFEQRQYEIDYNARVSIARQALIDKAGSQTRKFIPRFFGTDNFNKVDIERQAHQIVQLAHQQRLVELKDRERTALNGLLEGAEKLKETGVTVLRQFEQATDRRSGEDRRRSGPDR